MGNPLKRVEPFHLMLLLLDEKRHTLERWNDKAPLREPEVGFSDQRSTNVGDRYAQFPSSFIGLSNELLNGLL